MNVPPPKALREQLEKSGNNLHLDVLRMLGDLWKTHVSAYYVDDNTDKPREVDIIATRTYHLESRVAQVPQGISDEISVVLVIECKRFEKPVAFRMVANDNEEGKAAVLMNGMSVDKVISGGHHHYMETQRVAKLYDTTEGSRGSHDSVYAALTQAAKATLFFRDREGADGTQKVVYYPLVVYDGQDGIYEIVEGAPFDQAREKQVLLFGMDYAYWPMGGPRIRRQHLRVDVVHREALDAFLREKILEEVRALVGVWGGRDRYLVEDV